MHENGTPRASTPTVLVVFESFAITPPLISIPPSPSVIILFDSSTDEMHAPGIILKQF